tara:strand:- start:16743 stop:17681 length:939 start_codon:yes stop_codon:yes gene_type:complete
MTKMKKLSYALEGALCWALMLLFKILPVDVASALGGQIGQAIGFFMSGANKKADRHLRHAMPDLNAARRKTIIREMWNNMGRVFAEYPHLETIALTRTTVKNSHIMDSLRENPTGSIFIGLHQGNWEIWAGMALLKYGVQVDITYRAPNNPYVDKLVSKMRGMNGRITGYPKTRQSGKKIMAALKNKGNLAILIDQKYNTGLSIPFFGYPAKTNPAAFQLTRKYKCPLIPSQCIRTKGAHFDLIFHPPIPTHGDNGEERPLEETMQKAHLLMEDWIRQNPGQWIWLHKRWGDKMGQSGANATTQTGHNDTTT